MISGDCPICQAPIQNAFKGEGVYSSRTCKSCNKVYWLRHSRQNPIAVDDNTFRNAFDVNEETGEVSKKPPVKNSPQEYLEIAAKAFKESIQGKKLRAFHDKAVFNRMVFGQTEMPIAEMTVFTDEFFKNYPKYDEWLAERSPPPKQPHLRLIK